MIRKPRAKKAKTAGEAIADVVEAVGAGGRPSSFRPEFIDLAEKLCLLGATDEQMAEVFDVSVTTISNWKNEHPEFLEAIKRGKRPADAEVAASLYKRAQWTEYTEQQAIKVKDVQFDDKGKKIRETERVEVVEVKRMLPPSDTSMIFFLKNRFGEQWRDRVDHNHSGKVTVTHEERVKRRQELLAKRRGEGNANGPGARDAVH